jgi:hypothetical protein
VIAEEVITKCITGNHPPDIYNKVCLWNRPPDIYAGKTFKEGLYRIYKVNEFAKWNAIVGNAFPEFAEHIACFSYDWLGRHFALDFNRKEKNEPLILMLEPGTGEVLEIPTTFMAFHEEELVDYQDAALAVEFFNQWREKNKGICHLINVSGTEYRFLQVGKTLWKT